METAEVKTKRIRHCYHRDEVYHRFIHSDNYVYSPRRDRYNVSAKGNYFFIGDCGKNVSIEDIEIYWYSRSSKCVAVIDRDKKLIIINNKFKDHSWNIRRACPNDYKIFLINTDITKFDILSNIEECHKLHLSYLVKNYVENDVKSIYFVLAGHKRKIRSFNNNSWYLSKIIDHVKTNPIVKKYKWYKESLEKEYTIVEYNRNWNRTEVKIDLPSLYKIVNNKIFTPKQLTLIYQHLFYHTYCYGEGISLKSVITYWNKPIFKQEAYKTFRNSNISFEKLYEDKDNITWNDIVIYIHESNTKYIKRIQQEHKEQSERNRQKALEQLEESNKDVNVLELWREGKYSPIKKYIKYQYYQADNSKTYPFGIWRENVLYANSYNFKFTQLRLKGNIIQTSRGASVTLEDGIKCFKLFNYFIKHNKESYTFKTFDKTKYNVGIYNLRWFKYCEKEHSKEEWQIQIGCHTLWLDDIFDFIHYYHLEKQFEI